VYFRGSGRERFAARFFRRPSDEDGRLELLPSRQRATRLSSGSSQLTRARFVSRVALILEVHGTEPSTARRRLRAEREA
jgi:hypothetical protein